jgi:hypothetical protein
MRIKEIEVCVGFVYIGWEWTEYDFILPVVGYSSPKLSLESAK